MNKITIRAITQDELKTHYLPIVRKIQKQDNLLAFVPIIAYRSAIDKGDMFVALDGETPVGVLMLYVYKRDPKLKIAQVASAEKGKGVGKLLFDFALQTARERKLPMLVLQVRKDNANAIGFYEHLGMHREEERDTTYFYTLPVEK